MAEEEVAHHVVGNDSGTYKAGFAEDDAPRTVPSDVDTSHGILHGLTIREKISI